jgi:hypothetical protein
MSGARSWSGVRRWLRSAATATGAWLTGRARRASRAAAADIVAVPHGAGPAYLDAAAVGQHFEEQELRLDVALRHLEVATTHVRAARKALGP